MRSWRTPFTKHDEQLVTLAEAAQMLGVGSGAAARLVRARELPKVPVANASSRYRAADVRELAAGTGRQASRCPGARWRSGSGAVGGQ
jgi:predicted DNA-binding transcriptional regulator AlpA